MCIPFFPFSKLGTFLLVVVVVFVAAVTIADNDVQTTFIHTQTINNKTKFYLKKLRIED